MSDSANHAHEEPRVVVKDKRRIDPDTGDVRVNPDEAAETTPEESTPPSSVQAELDERTADLQRLQAEYANYRKRVDRDRAAVVTMAKAQMTGDLLPVLDDIERAAAHGDLTGALKSVADKLIATLQRTGLESFGHEGDAFDPAIHEAVQHNTSAEVTGPTVTGVLRHGYRLDSQILRPALVAVTDYESAESEVDTEPVSVEGSLDPATDRQNN